MNAYRPKAGLALAVALSLGLQASPVLAQTVDVNMNSDTLRASFGDSLPSINSQYELGLLTSGDHDADLVQAHAGLLVTGDAGASEANVVAGLGGRFVLLDVEDLDGGALALGGMLDARLPAFNRVGMLAYAYWAPGASSFGDLDGHIEYAASLDYEVIRNASLYAGYRQVRLRHAGDTSQTAETGFHFGLRLKF